MTKSQFQVEQLNELNSFDRNETISLSINLKLQNDGINSLMKTISLFNNIQNLYLSLSSNKIEEEGASQIAKALKKLKNLKDLTLILFGNNLKSKGGLELGKGLLYCNNLTVLTIKLSNSSLNYEGIQGICSGISKCYNLNQLSLNLIGNLIRNGIELLGVTFSQLQQLQHIQLECDRNSINEKSCIIFSDKIKKCAHLRSLHLNLQINEIMQGGVAMLESLITLPNLNFLRYNFRENKTDCTKNINQFKKRMKRVVIFQVQQ
ncbi:kinase domain protein (macronuclear) [Tetrahymena thermophila SB210]|uniref:Kinase domain protein n=1 Tax=Tetrahymena thermophila (strain SB210) TaxID=312017 RepID=W7X056_TETTS|nr:kinase domain protein [Tetrahymena thermophila SB210]EWS71252.1 kinase domain protein [Tetrahymena thermophila SB210]|eukprot:XP_012656212.1 kinase domain protein [Tetrahymena thermophila SB210]